MLGVVEDKRAIAICDYLFVSPDEMQKIVTDTECQIKEFIRPEEANYFAVISKKSLQTAGKVQ